MLTNNTSSLRMHRARPMRIRCEWCNITPNAWSLVDHGIAFLWRVNNSRREKLRALIPEHEYAQIFAVDDPAKVNKMLRVTLAHHVSAPNGEHAAAVARWIVREWGGIRSGQAGTIEDWSGRLGSYSEVAVNALVRAEVTNRISSWSKLLAFANHLDHAIYDSRTAVALNCALAHLDDPRRFHMPASRNQRVRAAVNILLEDPNGEGRRGYSDYIAFLKCSVEHAERQLSLLDAEMALFANAPLVAEKFVARRGARPPNGDVRGLVRLRHRARPARACVRPRS